MTKGFTIKFPGSRVRVSGLEKHQFVCDLAFIEAPLLSLFRDARHNWFYLWCDTDGIGRDRWLVFQVSRKAFAEYLSCVTSLRSILLTSKEVLCLETSWREPNESAAEEIKRGRLLSKVSPEEISAYLPSPESFFDATLAPDISLSEQLLPKRYGIAIGGDWFFGDLDRFSRAYAGLYGFFYCTKPRLVSSIRGRLSRALRAPWKGGFSRVNLFEGLARSVPSFHDLQIRKIQYASPGTVEIEALESVGHDIRESVRRYLENTDAIEDQVRRINSALTQGLFKKRNLSKVNDSGLGIADEQIQFFQARVEEIARLLDVESQLKAVKEESPNCVVAAKATLALLTHLKRLAEFENSGMLNLTGRGEKSENYANQDNWLEEFERSRTRG